MKLSKTSEYALRILSFMINSDMQVFTAKYLVENLDMPDKYLRRIMTDMSKKGFIKSLQGRDGGYVFAKNANKIYLLDVPDVFLGLINAAMKILAAYTKPMLQFAINLLSFYPQIRLRI